MKGSADVGWLTIQIRESSDRRLKARLGELVKRAHAFGLKAATIAQPASDAAIPRQTTRRVITLADGVVGTVTIADQPDQLHAFVADVASLLGVAARVELSVDGVVRELGAEPMAAS
jgi:hypothetical protein